MNRYRWHRFMMNFHYRMATHGNHTKFRLHREKWMNHARKVCELRGIPYPFETEEQA